MTQADRGGAADAAAVSPSSARQQIDAAKQIANKASGTSKATCYGPIRPVALASKGEKEAGNLRFVCGDVTTSCAQAEAYVACAEADVQLSQRTSQQEKQVACRGA